MFVQNIVFAQSQAPRGSQPQAQKSDAKTIKKPQPPPNPPKNDDPEIPVTFDDLNLEEAAKNLGDIADEGADAFHDFFSD